MKQPRPASDPRRKPETWGTRREYLSLVRWLVPDLLRHAGGRVVGVMTLSILSVAARAATLGVVVIYVNAQINGEPIVLLDQTLPSEASLASLAFWGG
ncbi:MAG: hypothetical protein GY733_10970, partial [bacterium]|nr:hypothetical protein [bacterium]